MNKKLEVNCPQCKKRFQYYSSEFRPFCSDRCKMVDMGAWTEEVYQIAGRTNSVYIEDPGKLQQLLEETNENY